MGNRREWAIAQNRAAKEREDAMFAKELTLAERYREVQRELRAQREERNRQKEDGKT